MLRAAGAAVDDAVPNVWSVEPGQLDGRAWTIEPDLSGAAPFLAAAMVTGGEVTVPDWPRSTTQPGDQLRELLTAMGARVSPRRRRPDPARHRAHHGASRPTCRDVSELTPVLAALAALGDRPSRLRGVGHIRGHETDRIAALARELGRLGAEIVEWEDGLEIRPRPLRGTRFETYADHRMAHAAAVIGLQRARGRAHRRGLHVQDDAGVPAALGEHGGGLITEAAARVRRGRRPGPSGSVVPPPYAHPPTPRRGRGRLRGGGGPGPLHLRRRRPDRHRHAGPGARPARGRRRRPGRHRRRHVGRREALARIVRIDERTSVLRRTADDDDTTVEGRQERVIVANVDQLVIVCSLADPPPRTGFIDRCLVAAYDADIEPLLCLTKADLAGPDDAARLLRRAGPAARARLAGPAAGRTGGRPARPDLGPGRATPASASPHWSTGSSRPPTGRSVW